jgi:hypothetical protein
MVTEHDLLNWYQVLHFFEGYAFLFLAVPLSSGTADTPDLKSAKGRATIPSWMYPKFRFSITPAAVPSDIALFAGAA